MKFFIGILTVFSLLACQALPLQETTQAENIDPPSSEVEASPPPEIQFFTFGDWGTGDASQQSVADALIEFCQDFVCDFGVLLGDNFYPSGVDSVTDPKWETHFEDVYSGLNVPFYAALGNHDHQGNPQAQIDYSDLQDRWIMPDRQFWVSFPEGSHPPLLEIFTVDSDSFSTADGTQLQTALQDSNAQWKILALHHPLYSNGLHGDTSGLKTNLLPIICQEVDIILSGHDHLFSHLSDPNDGCSFHQLVVGTGGRNLYSANPDPRVQFAKSTFGFATLKVEVSKITVQFHETDLAIPYSFSLEKGP